ncbi:bifunctional metallophosphatase/5'-nucleotidase [Lacrimispora sp. 38-1]|uniref:bifunctional metallophosphatase/5'-nucleotidase n=1 Tax=Lacrimispora sp. 38-1 TaxID=3125778 RepID=UPI003CE9FC6C
MKKKAKIYYTSDVHGYLFPTNYGDKTERPMGLLNCITNFEKDGNTLILDGGDTISGSPMAAFITEQAGELLISEPLAKVYNAAGYDAVVPGNHDFNFGYDRLAHYLGKLSAVCLCANAKDLKGATGIVSSHIFALENGLRLGVGGIVTDYVNVWENPEHLEQIQITDAFKAAKEELELLKKESDVTICIYHGGYECDLDTGTVLTSGNENIGYRILKGLDYDIVLTAHQHMTVKGRDCFGTHTLQLTANAVQYACIEIEYEDGACTVSSSILPAGTHHNREPYESLLPLEQQVQKWLDLEIGSLKEAIPQKEKIEMALGGSGVADFFNQIQLAYTGADISCIGLGNNPIALPAHVTMRDLVRVYPFSNTLVVLEVTQEVIRQALERCAEYFTVKEGKIEISEVFLKPKVEHYNYDYFAGITFEVDVERPVGNRVVNIIFEGKSLEGRKLKLCMSDYRASGTGGYEVYRQCPVLKRLGTEVPQLALEYLKKHPDAEIVQNGGLVLHNSRL